MVLLDFLLKNFGHGLVSTWKEVVGKNDITLVREVRVIVDGRIKVEQNWEVDALIWIEELVLKAETLDLVKVERHFFRVDLVNGDACNRLVRPVVHLVEG